MIKPELEVWVWANCDEIAPFMGWGDHGRDLRCWLETKGFRPSDHPKPAHPKEALDAVLREKRKKRSSRHFEYLATHLNFKGCVDEAFHEFRRIIQLWFPAEQS